ncbi:hypothetical protein K4H28_13200 [Deefgea tanakiae]|uniref:DUF4304 domain-containing protein n=1 Tax=Deefgea tanakiae TaxID=2865840 RepID=A0ABX8Z3U4_9NEIS|nr:hypothetical protein [Deefgea tanakiae]QZA77231.1 hypothetical protein K4H28_13200 [Deefgea tanakiae]
MKQSYFDKMLNRILKVESKRFGWKCSRGFVFKKEKSLFFTILINGQSKTKKLHWSLSFKHYDFDDIFWDVVKLPENKKQPLSFRACGAWVAPSMVVQEGCAGLDSLEEEIVLNEVRKIFELLIPISDKEASLANTYQSNLQILEKYYSQLIEKYPNAVRAIWVEKLLTGLLECKFDEAHAIAIARINAGDSGGFSYSGASFYQLATEYIKTQ